MENENYAKENCRTILKILTGKEHIKFTSRCNEAINLALKIGKNLGREICLMQEEGGWLTYPKYAKGAELEVIKLVTNYGLIFEKELKNYAHDSILIINSLAGYIAPQKMADIHAECLNYDVFLINDVSGSIGTPVAKFGEIIVGSFGEAKPVDMGHGGFIAVDDEDWIKNYEEVEINFNLLEKKLRNLEKRRKFLIDKAKEIKEDLKDFQIVHKNEEGLNVVVLFSNEEEKNKIIKYCEQNNLEYTTCPREIRILEDAISIEVKRLSSE